MTIVFEIQGLSVQQVDDKLYVGIPNTPHTVPITVEQLVELVWDSAIEDNQHKRYINHLKRLKEIK